MSAYDAALLIITDHPDFDPAVAAAVQTEQFLAVSRCNPRIEGGRTTEEWLPEYEDWITVYSPGRLYWDLTATVLSWEGLAHYHPGVALSRRALTSANVLYRTPFQRLSGGTLVYEDPRLEQNAGTLPVLSFTIAEVMDGGLDTVSYPGGGSTLSYYTLPAQETITLTTPVLTKLLQDIFQNTSNFDLDLLVTPYEGDPATTGTARLTPVTAPDWDHFETTAFAFETIASCAAFSFDPEGVQTFLTHFRHALGNGTFAFDIPAGAGFWLPADHTLLIPAEALSVQLGWPWDGVADLPTGWQSPAHRALRHLTGDIAGAGILGAGVELTIRAWDADPESGGTELTNWNVDRDATKWTVTGPTVTNAAILASSATAPGPGWETAYLTVEIPGVDTYWIRQAYAISTTAGNPISIPAGALSLTIE